MIVFPRAEIVGFEGDCPFRDGATRADGKTVRFWPSMSPVQAFGGEHQTDAHCVSYDLVNAAGAVLPQAPRINKEALPALAALGIRPVFSALLIDLDDKVGKDSSPDRSARPEWRAAFSESVARLPAWLQPHLVRYDTRGGARLLIVTEPLELDAYERARDGLYALCANAGMEVDRLTDWNRLMRLPNVMRDGKRQAYKVDVAPMSTPLTVELAATLAMHIPPPPPPLPPAPPRPPRPVQYTGESERPGDTFNRLKSWDDVLLPMGWMRSHDHQGRPAYRRPGSKKTPSEHSAYVTPDGNLFVRTTSMEPHGLNGNTSYTPFGLMAATWGMAPDEAAKRVREQLVDEGLIAAYVDRLADPDLIDLVRGGELARQDWEAVRAAAPKAEKAKGKAKADAPHMHGSHEIRFATASDTELSGALVDDTKTDDGEGGKVAMVWDEGQFWRYEAGVWRSLDDKSLERHVHGFDGVYCFDPDDEDSKKRPWKLKMTHGRVVGVVASTRAMLHRDHWFDHAPTGVMFSDVFVTIDDHGQIRGEYVSPEHRQRHRLEQDSGPLAFTPGAIPAMYLDLIRRGFGPCVDLEEKVQLWREWAGLALLGRQTFRRAMFLLGDSGSGKSVTAKVLLGLLPDVAKTSMTMANIDPVGFGKSEYYLADLSTSRINADLDVRASMFVAGENFMKLVSQDPIAARQPGGKTFTFKPRTAMLMAGETLPTPDNKNPGFFNRFIILRFAGGAVAEGQAVYEYERNILEAERAEIASWLIEGAAMAIQRGRFEIPASVQHERQAWAQAVDSVHLWLVECTTDSSIIDPNDWVKAGVLFGHYREWCGKNGYQPVAINKFGERLRKALPAERWSEQSRDRQTRYRVRVLSQSEMEALR
jgi:P4 family phage/plasmid primase-like protien